MKRQDPRHATFAWIRANAGGGRIALIEGPARSGRSHVWRRALDEAEGERLQAEAATADRGRPWSTLQRMLANWVAAAEGRPAIRATRDLHTMAVLVPDLGPSAGPIEPTRLQAELTSLLRRLARSGPVWVAVDDLHLADAHTRDLMAAAARGCADEDVRVLATTRSGHDLPSARVHVLPPLTGLPEAAGGLPGLAAWIDGDRLHPELIRRAHARAEALDPASRSMLRTLAVADGPVDCDALIEVSGVEGPDRALDDLEAEGWVRCEADGPGIRVVPLALAWTRALVEGLSPRVVQRLHAAWLGQPLEPAARLHHTLGAGTRADADAVRRLRGAATQAPDHTRAIALLGTACALARRRGTLEAGLLLELGRALAYADRFDEARRAWEEGLEADRVPADVARLRRSLALLDWDEGNLPGAFEQLRAGWRELDGHSGPDVEALVRTELIFLDRRLDYAGQLEAAHRLEEIATTPEARSDVWQVRAATLCFRGDPAAEAAIERSIALADGVRDLRVLHRARHGRNMARIGSGRPREALALLEADGDHTAYGMTARVLAHLMLGDLEAIEALGTVGGDPTGRAQLARSCAAALRGEAVAFVSRRGDDADPLSTQDLRVRAFLLALQAMVHHARQEPQLVVDRFEESGLIRGGRVVGPLALDSTWLLGIALARLGRTEGARELARQLPDRPAYAPEVAAGIQAAIRHDQPGSAARYLDAARAFEARGLVRHAAWCRLDAAEGEPRAQGVRDGLDRCWSDLVPLRCDADLARARAAYQRLGVRPPVTPRRRATGGPLSARELDVVERVARGLSNKEVAAELFLSPSTVATHLKRVYRRLGVNNRAALTRWAADEGLLGAE